MKSIGVSDIEYLIGPTINVKLNKYAGNIGQIRRVASDMTPGKPSKDRTVVGIVGVYGNVDDGGDIVVPGAFKRAIEEFKAGRSRCAFLWQHDYGQPPTAQILELKEVGRAGLPDAYQGLTDVSGALMVTRKYLNDPASERVYQGVITRAIREMSFAYRPIKYHIEKTGSGQEIRILEELDLLDCSDVVYGMNPLTMAASKGKPEIVKASSIAGLRMLKDMRRELADFTARMEPRSHEVGDFDRWLTGVTGGSDRPVLPGSKSGPSFSLARMQREFLAAFGELPPANGDSRMKREFREAFGRSL